MFELIPFGTVWRNPRLMFLIRQLHRAYVQSQALLPHS